MIRNRIKRRAKAGEKLLGAWVFTGSPAACEIYALAGYDIVLIDSEHTPIDVKDVLECVRAVEAGGGDAMVRVPGHDSSHFKRLLDAGIHSFMVPMVDTVDQAHAIVRSCLYPPRGRRGFAATAARSGLYGFHEDYAASPTRRPSSPCRWKASRRPAMPMPSPPSTASTASSSARTTSPAR